MDLRSASPFWLLRSGLLTTYPPITGDAHCDVVIIGAGITGALAAHTLVREGHDVIVLDRRDATLGSTVASTGLLLCETDVELRDLQRRVGSADAVRSWQLGREAVARIGCLAQQLCTGDFRPRDTLYIASRRRHVPRLIREFETRHHHGFDVNLLSRRDLAGNIDAEAAILSRGNAEIDPYRFTHALLDDAIRHGARVFDRSEVVSVEGGRRGFEIRTERGPRVRCRVVVYATGYESERYLGRRIGRLWSTFVAVSEPIDSAVGGQPMVWETARPYLYVRGTPDGRLMAGGADLHFSESHARPGVIAHRVARIEEAVQSRLPGVPWETAFAWGGTFGTTPDGLPRIGEHPDQRDTYFALGFGGNGITFAMIAAHILADLIAGRRTPDARLFRLNR